MRLLPVALLCCASSFTHATTIDLDAPDAMSHLARSNPSHQARVLKLVAAAEREPCRTDTFRRLQVAVAAKDLDCSMLVMTSNPPKQRLTFALDDRVYTTVVVMHHATVSVQRLDLRR